MTNEVIVIGGCVIDLVSYVQRFPKPGETLIGKKFHKAFGGKGANQCTMVAKLGASTTLIAKVGNDSFGQEFLTFLESINIHNKHVTVENSSHTSTANISVTERGENSIVHVFGAINYLTVDDVKNAANELFADGKVLICTYEGPKMELLEALKLAKARNMQTLVNAAPLSNDHYLELLEYTDFICVNETEAETLCNAKVETIEEAELAAQSLLKKVNQGVILTLGEKGAIFCTKTEPKPIHVAAPKVQAIDTTGAGDAFMGSFAYFMTHHKELSLEEKVRRSCVIASVSVQKEGTQISFPGRDQLPNDLFI